MSGFAQRDGNVPQEAQEIVFLVVFPVPATLLPLRGCLFGFLPAGAIDEETESTEQSVRQDEHHRDAVRETARDGSSFSRILKGRAAQGTTLCPQIWMDPHN